MEAIITDGIYTISLHEAYDAFNTLVGFCVEHGMQEGIKSDTEICEEISKFLPTLRKGYPYSVPL